MQQNWIIIVHYCNILFSDDHDMYWYFKQVFDKAGNFDMINLVELGGGTNNNGITELTYQSTTGNKITLSVDGGFPVPELANFDMRADSPTKDFIAELVSAFSQYHNKNFYKTILLPENFSSTFQDFASF